ncbi:hypothetical protein [Bradyrhizobium sp. Tv2a-2]|uniref:hypothetical protein n=1 Tax=Bradyrhizobium sp. Tv2a-2 TaxID=113395 RepID=UPI0012EB4762|nr:hypothetical protein [Bradyrhizobium sp. Tv2a-2]
MTTLPFVSARTPKSPPLPPTARFVLVAVIVLPAPVAQKPVSPPPEEDTELLIVLFVRLMLAPFCALKEFSPPDPLVMFIVKPSAVTRLAAPSDKITAIPNPPLGTVIDELGVNSMTPPFVASISAVPKPFGHATVMPFAMIVPPLASIASAPPPVFPSVIPLAMIVPPLAALKPMPAAVTLPFAVTVALVVALIPVPPPLAVTVPFVVTLAAFDASTAVPKPVLTLLLSMQVPPL